MAARTWIWVVPLLAICGAGCSESDVPASSAKQPARPANLPLAPAVATAVLPAPAPAVARGQDERLAGIHSAVSREHRHVRSAQGASNAGQAGAGKDRRGRPCPCTRCGPGSPGEETPPPLRLVGFVNVASPKALLSLDGKLSAVQTGETIQEVEVLAIEPPSVKLKFDNEEYSINLLERSPEGVRTSMRVNACLPDCPRCRAAQQPAAPLRPPFPRHGQYGPAERRPAPPHRSPTCCRRCREAAERPAAAECRDCGTTHAARTAPRGRCEFAAGPTEAAVMSGPVVRGPF